MGSLAPGFRFHPTDEELVMYYLKRLICGKLFHVDAISVIDIYKYEPSDLPGLSRLKSRDLEWYFFSPLDKKYGSGSRTNRATDQGYWKTTGKDRPVRKGDRTVGMKKTLVFHIGRPSSGERTNWVMHEYRIVDEELGREGVALDAFVLCRVFKKSGSGPRNGEQYGAPYVEEEWDDNVLVPEIGVSGDAHYMVGAEEDLQKQNDDEKNLELADPFVHGLPVSSDGLQPIVGLVENDGFPELLDDQQFFQMDQPPIPNEYFELDDLLNSLDADSNTVNPVDGELACYDALSHDPSSVNGSFLEINDLNPVIAEPSGFEMLDHNPVDGELAYYDALSHDPSGVNGSFLEINDLNPLDAEPSVFEMVDQYLEYFDATDNYLNYMVNDSSIVSKDEDPILNQSALTEERTRGNGPAYPEPPEPSKTHGDKGASSSTQKTQTPTVAPDVQYSEGWGSTLAKQASVILGSISAPPAFAAEFPTKESTFGQNSTTHSSSSIHVTSGMIHISGVTVNGDGKSWFFEKSEDADFLLPYDMKRDDVMTVERLIRNSTEPMSNISLSKTGTVMVQSGFYCIFLWVLILSVSYKIGSYIYSG